MTYQMALFDVPPDMARRAILDDTYRYVLWRIWAGASFDPSPRVAPSRLVNWIMLNPSTADGLHDDPTIRRCIGFARDWGYDGIVVTNLFALRATDPAELRKHAAPVGPLNDRYVLEQAHGAQLVVCAWGNDGGIRPWRRSRDVVAMLRNYGITLHRLKWTQTGEPSHPLYLRGTLRPEVW